MKYDDLQTVAKMVQFRATPPPTGKRCIAELTSEFQHEIESLTILEPKLPAHGIAAQAIQEAEPELVSELSGHLLLSFAIRLVRIERAKQSRERHEQLSLPGFEHLPERITVTDKKRVYIQEATYTDLREYVRRLSNRYRDRMRNDPKLADGRALLKRIARYNRKTPGIKVKEVMLRDAER